MCACRFMPAVDAAAELSSMNDTEATAETYGRVREAVNQGMADLLAERERDPLRSLQARLRQAVTQNAPAFDLLRGVMPGRVPS